MKRCLLTQLWPAFSSTTLCCWLPCSLKDIMNPGAQGQRWAELCDFWRGSCPSFSSCDTLWPKKRHSCMRCQTKKDLKRHSPSAPWSLNSFFSTREPCCQAPGPLNPSAAFELTNLSGVMTGNNRFSVWKAIDPMREGLMISTTGGT